MHLFVFFFIIIWVKLYSQIESRYYCMRYEIVLSFFDTADSHQNMYLNNFLRLLIELSYTQRDSFVVLNLESTTFDSEQTEIM